MEEQGKPIEINVADVVIIGTDEVSAVLSEEQRSLLKRVLEKVLSSLFAVEVGVEVAPDGTVRIFGRLRT
jgi:hypothetical protein